MEEKKALNFVGVTDDILKSVDTDIPVISRRAPEPVPVRKVVRTSDKYKNILSPLKLNDKYTMKNRVMCAPMVFGTAVVGNEYGNAAYAPGKYGKLEMPAAGGTAMVSVGETDINNFDAKRMPLPDVDYSIRSGEAFNAISEYAWRIKRHGAIALIELNHCGFMKPPIPGTEIWGPSAGFTPEGAPIKEMDEEMMDSVCRDFVNTALFMQEAGFDGVCIHAGHGFLMMQFVSPLTNKRTDEYGGSIDNRCKFPVRIFREIREAVGPDFIIEARVSGVEGLPGGMTIEDTARFIQLSQDYINGAHVSCGTYSGETVEASGMHAIFEPHGYNLPNAKYVKDRVNIPIGVVGFITDPDFVEAAIADGSVDYVVMGRQMIADPEYVNKLATGREKEIRRCIGCITCFEFPDPEQEIKFDGVMPWLKVGNCAINPIANSEKTVDEMPKPEGSRKVLIVGGGPAGIQAAITAADRGHKPILVDENDKLGGTLFFTDVDVDKKDISQFKDTIIYEVSIRDIDVRLNTKVTPEMIKEIDPDVLILATGSTEKVIPIPGIENAIPALEVYRHPERVGQKVVIVGGGLVGTEEGLHLAKTGHDVTVVEMIKRLAHESCGTYRNQLMYEFEKAGAKGYARTKVIEIKPTGVDVEKEDGSREFLPADTVIAALGYNEKDTSELEAAAGRAKVYKIGDCSKVAKIGGAIRAGFDAAMDIL
ncbi:MAG: FAD-dependent oxidoreductase [Lachnospiraceae bacterium]|nr:FAD-dependent oxidoreductase [Lachnospiraceae bacterium]